MAYPIVSAPYGLKAYNEIGGLPYAGSTRMIPIASGYGTSLFYGDTVQLSAGTLVAGSYNCTSSPTSPIAGTIGVFVGCEYTNPGTNQRIRAQYWPASTVAQDAVAYVIDDPRTVFRVAVGVQGTSLANSGTTIGYMSETFVGTNVYPLTGNTGSTTSGDSALLVTGGVISSGTSGNTRLGSAAAPFRVVQLVPDTAVSVAATASTSGSSTTVTLTAANSAISPGMQLIAPTGTGSLAGNFITVTNVNGTAVTVSSAVTLASGTAVTFVGYPEVLVTWNNTFHSYTNSAGV